MKKRADELADPLGLIVTEAEGQYQIDINAVRPGRIGTDRALYRGSIDDVLHYLERTSKGALPEGRRPNTWATIVSPQAAIWHQGKYDESMGEGKIVAEWNQEEGSLLVGTEGFLSIGMNANVEVAWLSGTGERRAIGSVDNDFCPCILQSNDGLGPKQGDALRVHRKYSSDHPAQNQDVSVTVELS